MDHVDREALPALLRWSDVTHALEVCVAAGVLTPETLRMVRAAMLELCNCSCPVCVKGREDELPF